MVPVHLLLPRPREKMTRGAEFFKPRRLRSRQPQGRWLGGVPGLEEADGKVGVGSLDAIEFRGVGGIDQPAEAPEFFQADDRVDHRRIDRRAREAGQLELRHRSDRFPCRRIDVAIREAEDREAVGARLQGIAMDRAVAQHQRAQLRHRADLANGRFTQAHAVQTEVADLWVSGEQARASICFGP